MYLTVMTICNHMAGEERNVNVEMARRMLLPGMIAITSRDDDADTDDDDDNIIEFDDDDSDPDMETSSPVRNQSVAHDDEYEKRGTDVFNSLKI